MSAERRRAPRQTIQWESLIVDLETAPICPCMMVNISATGAKLVLPTGQEVPDRFVLILSKKGQVRRHCQVSWRSDDSVGVNFVSPAQSVDAFTTSFISDALARIAPKN